MVGAGKLEAHMVPIQSVRLSCSTTPHGKQVWRRERNGIGHTHGHLDGTGLGTGLGKLPRDSTLAQEPEAQKYRWAEPQGPGPC